MFDVLFLVDCGVPKRKYPEQCKFYTLKNLGVFQVHASSIIKDAFTLGARLTTFPHPFILRSALTSPPIRVPSISRLLLSSTAALSSKRMILPSGLRTGLRVRTITARRTSPRRTLTAFTDACEAAEIGRAFFTTQTISSPTEPQPLLTLFLRIFTHSTRSAPELSMT